jgi:hypothetical protein
MVSLAAWQANYMYVHMLRNITQDLFSTTYQICNQRKGYIHVQQPDLRIFLCQ